MGQMALRGADKPTAFPISYPPLPTLFGRSNFLFLGIAKRLLFNPLAALLGTHVRLASFVFHFHKTLGLLGANRAPNATPLKAARRQSLESYSNLRISTGRSRDASFAGSNVATTAIPMAAMAIHIPSRKLA